MNYTEYLSNGKIVFHSYDALKEYSDNPENPLDAVVLGKEIDSLSSLFACSKRTNEQFKGITDWDVSNVEDMRAMFFGAHTFNQPIGNWDVSNVEDMQGMFWFAYNFNQPIGNWDVSKVEGMEWMFESTENFNQPLDNWDVSKVSNMETMFWEAKNFNQPLDNFSSEQKRQANYHFDEVKYKKEQARN